MSKAASIIDMLSEAKVPQMVIDKVGKMRKEGKSEEEISKILKIRTITLQQIK